MAELSERLGVASRQVYRFIRQGMPSEAAPRVAGRPGRPARMIDLGAARKWLTENKVNGWKRKVVRSGDEVASVAVVESELVPIIAAGAAEDNDGPLEMYNRVKAAEILVHDQWKGEVNLCKSGDGKGDPHLALAYQQAWYEILEKRRRIEKDIPAMMVKRGRFVDIHIVRRDNARAAAVTASELDKVGESCSETCVGKTATDIRDIINEANYRARLTLCRELEKI